MERKAKNPIKSTLTTFTVLQALQDLNGAGVSKLATYLGLPKSTVHNYLSTLKQEEYVVKEGNTYHIGIRLLEFGTHARQRQEIYRIGRPEVDRLAEETQELANLLIEEHGRGIYLYHAKSERGVQVDARAGTRVYLHNTALGKAILAYMDESRVDEIVDQHGLPATTANTVTDRAALRDRLSVVRDRGYAIDDEERLEGLRCVAAPVLSVDNRVFGAVSVSAPTNRLRKDTFHETIPAKVRAITNAIELNIAYS